MEKDGKEARKREKSTTVDISWWSIWPITHGRNRADLLSPSNYVAAK